MHSTLVSLGILQANSATVSVCVTMSMSVTVSMSVAMSMSVNVSMSVSVSMSVPMSMSVSVDYVCHTGKETAVHLLTFSRSRLSLAHEQPDDRLDPVHILIGHVAHPSMNSQHLLSDQVQPRGDIEYGTRSCT